MKIVIAARHWGDHNIGGLLLPGLIKAIGRIDTENRHEILMPDDSFDTPSAPERLIPPDTFGALQESVHATNGSFARRPLQYAAFPPMSSA